MNKMRSPIGEPIPVGTIPEIAESKPPALPAPTASPDDQWSEVFNSAWQLSLVPALTWTSYAAASWKAWENTWQRYWPAH
jgi:hypothetical protein